MYRYPSDQQRERQQHDVSQPKPGCIGWFLLILCCVFVGACLCVLSAQAQDDIPAAHIECDGDGNYGVNYHVDKIFSNSKIKTKWFHCIRVHEKEHLKFLKHIWPTFCEDKPRSMILLDPVTLHVSECIAGYVEKLCVTLRIDFMTAQRQWEYTQRMYGCTLDLSKRYRTIFEDRYINVKPGSPLEWLHPSGRAIPAQIDFQEN